MCIRNLFLHGQELVQILSAVMISTPFSFFQGPTQLPLLLQITDAVIAPITNQSLPKGGLPREDLSFSKTG